MGNTKMGSFAELKRRVKVGTVIEAMPGHSWEASVGQPRTVRIVQTNGWAADRLDRPRDGTRANVSWLYWPRASLVKYEGDTFTIHDGGGGSLPYRIVSDVEATS